MVLAPRPWRYVGGNPPPATGARKAASPGRSRISRNTIARGKPGWLGCTCGLTRVHFCSTLRTRDCGRSRRPAFPAPSDLGGTTRWQHSGEKPAAGTRTHVYPPMVRSAKRVYGRCWRIAGRTMRSATIPRDGRVPRPPRDEIRYLTRASIFILHCGKKLAHSSSAGQPLE